MPSKFPSGVVLHQLLAGRQAGSAGSADGTADLCPKAAVGAEFVSLAHPPGAGALWQLPASPVPAAGHREQQNELMAATALLFLLPPTLLAQPEVEVDAGLGWAGCLVLRECLFSEMC